VSDAAPRPEPAPIAVDADAEITAARAAYTAAVETPFTLPAQQLAAEQRFENAYKARYGHGPASSNTGIPAMAPSPPTVETAPGRIRELRAELATVTDARRHDALMGQLEQAYRVLHPESVGEKATSSSPETPEGTQPPAEPDRLPHPPAGLQWDAAAAMDVYQAVERAGLPKTEFHQGLALAAQLAAGPMPTAEEAEAELRAKWGEDYDTKLKAARTVAKRLPARVLDHLDDSGLGNHPTLIQHLAELSGRLPTRTGG
jgi:hypothetical protein